MTFADDTGTVAATRGDTPTPTWAAARRCADEAYRWMLLDQDPRVDHAVRLVMATVLWREHAAVVGDPEAEAELSVRVAAGHWLCEQLSLYDLGGLEHVIGDVLDDLDEKVGDDPAAALPSRLDVVRLWPRAPISGFVLLGGDAGRLHVAELAGGSVLDVVDADPKASLPVGGALLGRLVPSGEEDEAWLFDVPPRQVDLRTARGVARSAVRGPSLGWLDVLAEASEEDRLPADFGARFPGGSSMSELRALAATFAPSVVPGVVERVESG